MESLVLQIQNQEGNGVEADLLLLFGATVELKGFWLGGAVFFVVHGGEGWEKDC